MSVPLSQSGGGGSSTPSINRNPQTGTSYAILNTDLGKTIELTNATAATIIALSIAQAGTASAFADGWYCDINNIGQNAALLTPTTSTIAGVATLLIPPGAGLRIYSDGTNFQIVTDGPNSAASSGQGGFGSWGLPEPITITASNVAISGSTTAVKTVQFNLPFAQVIRRAAFWIGTTGAAGNKAYAAIYDANRNKVFQAFFSTTTVSTKVVDSSFTSVMLLPGVYYYALACDSVTPTTDVITPSNGGTGLLPNNTIAKIGTAANALAAGVMPSALGTVTATSISAGFTWFEA